MGKIISHDTAFIRDSSPPLRMRRRSRPPLGELLAFPAHDEHQYLCSRLANAVTLNTFTT
jgi:hypothetical protein